MARTTPADSWPRMCVSVTTMGPIRPACQKWMSDLLGLKKGKGLAGGAWGAEGLGVCTRKFRCS